MQPRTSASFRTEVEFTLPKGYLDATGILHRKGIMRLATAADEILPLRDPRVQQNQAYLAIIVLARVITKLGDLNDIDTKVVEGFFASDLDYLQRLYERINGSDDVDAPLDVAESTPALLRNDGAVPQKGFRTVGEA
jgi:hypothetical protein